MDTLFSDTALRISQSTVDVLKLDQHLADGTTANPEWLAWRKLVPSDGRGPKITATAAATIDGQSPYQTRYGLWLELTEQAPMVARTQAPEFVLQRGLFAEKGARQALAEYLRSEPQWTGYDTSVDGIDGVLVSRSNEFDFVAASLDATLFEPYGGTIEAIGEFKLNGRDRHQFALEGRLPADHYAQVQWQLLAANAMTCFYVSTPFSGDGERKIIRVDAAPQYQERLLSDVIAFRNAVVSRAPPETVGGAQEAIIEQAIAAYLCAQAALQDAEAESAAQEVSLKAILIARGHGSGFTGCGVSYEMEAKRGSVAWAKVMKAMAVGPSESLIEAHRGKSSEKMVLKVTEESDGFLALYAQKNDKSSSVVVEVPQRNSTSTAW